MVIKKEQFVAAINLIEESRKKQDTFIAALETLSPATYCDCFLYADYEQKMIELLQLILDDIEDDIGYFLYEVEPEERAVAKKQYQSAENLYDYLTTKK